MKLKRISYITLLSIIFILSASLVGCQPVPSLSNDNLQQQADLPLVQLTSSKVAFSPYQEEAIDLKPSLKDYLVLNDLSNVTNSKRFPMSAQAKNLLQKNGFVVTPSSSREFFIDYELNRYDSIPNFVTTDAMLHNYHLYFNHLLRTLEKDRLRGELSALTGLLLDESKTQYQTLKGTEWENAAKRNIAFFSVASCLLDPKAQFPSYVSTEVYAELQLISTHQAMFVPSPVLNMGSPNVSLAEALKEDYTQYLPRGHYAKTEELQSYFQTMMWYGRMTFRAVNEDETKSAALITLAIGREEVYRHWNLIYEPTNFFVGKSDDLGFSQYYNLLKETFGYIPTLDNLKENAAQWKVFGEKVKKLKPPAINSIPIFDQSIQPDREKEIKGFRVMGQRFTLDASIFQRLVYREVEENKAGQRRMLPKGLDIPAAMGSQEAYTILNSMGETAYEFYPEAMTKLKNYLSSLDTETWTQNLYWSWLYTLQPLTEPKGKGYPAFMFNQAWTRKQLETYLGSWTELKHDTLLYAKQVYAEMGGGMEPMDDRGYVEPNPVLYARLAALTRMTLEGLENRNLLTESDRASMERMEEMALKFKTIAEKELTDQPLTDQEFELIRSFGGQLEHFWLEALKDEGVDHRSAMEDNPAALIADVATDPGGQVLEEGTGFVSNIYVVVPVDGKLRIAKGAVFSYYEFPWPARDRLTDQTWKKMLEDDNKPTPPSWTNDYTVPAW